MTSAAVKPFQGHEDELCVLHVVAASQVAEVSHGVDHAAESPPGRSAVLSCDTVRVHQVPDQPVNDNTVFRGGRVHSLSILSYEIHFHRGGLLE